MKPTFFVVLLIFTSILSGCVSDNDTIITENENDNQEESTNNTGNETSNNTGNETSNNTGNETSNNTGNETSDDTLSLPNQCLTGHSNLAMHIHPWLNLTVSGAKIPIPANMGIDTIACPNAMHLLHTHDDTGKLHIETYEPITLNLSLFFAVWNISQSGDSTFDPLFLDPGNVTIIIDGVVQNLRIDEIILEDGISINITYDESDNYSLEDDDGDGMPNGWEVQNGLDPLDSSDAHWCEGDWAEGDSDGVCNDGDEDGLSNLEEFLNSTNPNSPDSDGDGLPDGYEVVNMLDPLNSSDASIDQDGDGLNNTEEFEVETDPNNADTDGDGVGDNSDAFPNNPNEWEDLDGDGIGNNADLDDDGDSCEDNMDWAPLNSTECFDTDGDGVGDNADPHPWINNTGNGTFTMNYTMIGISYGHEIYWLSGQSECPCYAYYYTTTPDLVWTTGNRSPVISHENMPNVDYVLGLMGLTINNLSVSSYPMDLGTDTQSVEWDYNPNTGIEWRALSSNLSILYVDEKPIFSINASMMLYLDYFPMLSGGDPTMWGESSLSPITSLINNNDALIYQHLFNAFFVDFGENKINYSFTTQDAILTNDYVFTAQSPNITPWLSTIVSDSGENDYQVPAGLFDSVVSEVNVEQSPNQINLSKSVRPSENKMQVSSQRIKDEDNTYSNLD